ncbi:MAG TPA: MBL fold metallo-hydrolase [Candidatus Dormibacteraeota bacterium]|nr:MBL fold metallo-hydrolase [Candidatus Dormibacteraeota bacterium]
MGELLPGIWTWSWLSPPHGYNFNGYLLQLAGGNLCIDPADPTPEDLTEIVHRGVSRILLTNRNHARDANRIRSRTGARTAIHAADAGYAQGQGALIDDLLAVGDVVGPLHVVGVPGKSAGEIALHWPERRLLIVGDAVIGNPPGQLSLLREKVMDDPATLRASVRRLLDLDFDTLLVGDGTPILKDARARLATLVATFPDPC